MLRKQEGRLQQTRATRKQVLSRSALRERDLVSPSVLRYLRTVAILQDGKSLTFGGQPSLWITRISALPGPYASFSLRSQSSLFLNQPGASLAPGRGCVDCLNLIPRRPITNLLQTDTQTDRHTDTQLPLLIVEAQRKFQVWPCSAQLV